MSQALAEFLFSKFPSIVLCSATLTSNQQFGYIRERLGLTPKLLPERRITENIYGSPFDFRRQAMLAVPTDMPPPGHADFDEIAFENVWKAIEASRGQAFVLFTSYSMMQNCHEALAKRLEAHRYPLFKQGDDNRQSLLSKLKRLIGPFYSEQTHFGKVWMSQEMRCGASSLSNSPLKYPANRLSKPVRRLLLNGEEILLRNMPVPNAIVKFKQGFGRLIRQKSDRGCIVCLDTRLVMKNYGKLFLNSLPDCERIFMNGYLLWPKMEEFYRKTYHFVKPLNFS